MQTVLSLHFFSSLRQRFSCCEGLSCAGGSCVGWEHGGPAAALPALPPLRGGTGWVSSRGLTWVFALLKLVEFREGYPL